MRGRRRISSCDDAPPELFNEQGEFTFAILGYNEQGQNIFARLAMATRTSLTIGLAAVIIIVVIGVFVGSIAGYVGGWVDNLLMRFVDIMLSLPGLFIILMITAFFGQGNVWVVDLRHRPDGLDDRRAARSGRVPEPARG